MYCRERFGDTKRYGRAGSASAAAADYSVERGSEIRKDTDAQVQCPLLLLSIMSTEVRRAMEIQKDAGAQDKRPLIE